LAIPNSLIPIDKQRKGDYPIYEAKHIMSLTDLKGFIDLGGVFILAMVLLKVWGDRLEHIEDKMTRIIVLLSLALKDKVSAETISTVLDEKELKVAETLK